MRKEYCKMVEYAFVTEVPYLLMFKDFLFHPKNCIQWDLDNLWSM